MFLFAIKSESLRLSLLPISFASKKEPVACAWSPRALLKMFKFRELPSANSQSQRVRASYRGRRPCSCGSLVFSQTEMIRLCSVYVKFAESRGRLTSTHNLCNDEMVMRQQFLSLVLLEPHTAGDFAISKK